MSAYFVTGATGFVGGALVLELLARTDKPVVCMVRDTGIAPQSRLENALRHAEFTYEYPRGFVDSALDRVHAVAGDLDGVIDVPMPEGVYPTEFWHCAASLRFHDKDRDEIFSTNVNGTRNALEFAKQLGVDVFNYVSTAYVAGRAVGHISEKAVARDVKTHNLYEQSKIEAEYLVQESSLRTRIFRPSIVVGHSKTFGATSFTGLYGMLKELVHLRDEVTDTLGSFLEMRALQMLADPASTVNLIPVDLVVDRAVTLSLADVSDEVIHLSNRSAPTVGRCLELMFEALGLRAPDYVPAREHLSSLDAEFDDHLDFYRSYLSGAKEFEQRASEAHGGAMDYSFDDTTFTAFIQWYLRHLGVAFKSTDVATAVVAP
ncbi:SDR family oxidoreductase [Rhodococcoides fascians]|uniref:SDR family oxidoreductase n=1 Tax=Rhodococcoides fascians TaxID=1828 RepID=UPI001DF0F67C|nr:SDR family oxidoreductase [Rhodococcus fascians]CAH0284006.1 hypothetical protein SRABI91_04015 [Rhodococcus fascians]